MTLRSVQSGERTRPEVPDYQQTHALAVTTEQVSELRTYHQNPRQGDVKAIRESLRVNGQYRPIVVNRGTHTGRANEVLAGNHTLMAARDEGWTNIAVCWIDVDDDQATRIVLADNRTADLGDYDQQSLADLLDGLPTLEGTGYTDDDLATLLGGDEPGGEGAQAARQSLTERFGVPPLSVLDARQGYWSERKRQWVALGLRSEIGRDADLIGWTSAAKFQARLDGRDENGGGRWLTIGTSIFDPVLTELLVRWYSAPGGRVLDPFAGGAVRGIISAVLGRSYVGIDLRPEQVAANEEQARDILPDFGDGTGAPRWFTGDARDARTLLADEPSGDLMLTCPPYFDLEQYSDNPADLSRSGDYDAFLADYRDCLAAASDRMAPNAFAAIVTGAVRDKRGYVLDLPSDTSRLMTELGWRLYQDAVLVTPVGTAALRTGRAFTASRKLGRVHQAVAVYARGDVIKAVRDWPVPEVGDLAEPPDEEAGDDDGPAGMPGEAAAGGQPS